MEYKETRTINLGHYNSIKIEMTSDNIESVRNVLDKRNDEINKQRRIDCEPMYLERIKLFANLLSKSRGQEAVLSIIRIVDKHFSKIESLSVFDAQEIISKLESEISKD